MTSTGMGMAKNTCGLPMKNTSNSYEHAKDVFAYHFHKYEATGSTPVSTPQPTPGPQPATLNSFLANIAHHSSSVLITAPKPASEFN